MSAKRWILSFFIAIACLLVADYFFIHRLFPVKKESILNGLSEKVEEDIRRNPLVPIPATPDELPRPRNEPAP